MKILKALVLKKARHSLLECDEYKEYVSKNGIRVFIPVGLDESEAFEPFSEHYKLPLGERLTKVRGEKGFSQKRLSEITGVAQSEISYIESGSTRPNLKTIDKLCKGLGVSFNFFADSS